MTDAERCTQLYNDFQLVYNNLASNLAPGLDTFEISMYLTKAYQNFVLSTYNEYEKNETVRKALIELIKPATLTSYTPSTSTDKICSESLLYELPDDVLKVVYEAIVYDNTSSTPKCYRGKTLQVYPVSHDYFHQIYNNPFRFNKHRALRLDIDIDSKRIAELVPPDSHVSEYNIRYIQKPGPVIIANLGTDMIDGISTITTPKTNPMYDKDIVRLAAQMAYNDYKAA